MAADTLGSILKDRGVSSRVIFPAGMMALLGPLTVISSASPRVKGDANQTLLGFASLHLDPLGPWPTSRLRRSPRAAFASTARVPAGYVLAVAPYKVAVWKRVAAADGPRFTGEPPLQIGVTPDQKSLEHVDSAGDAIAFTIALIDPLGRLGAVGQVTVDPV